MPEKRILLVEDEPQILNVLEHVLRSERYVLDTARTVPDAMALLDGGSYALAIVDWRLPDGGDGLTIADAAAERGAKTIIMSAYLFQMQSGRVRQHETLMKPIRPSEMIAIVERAIGKADAS
jgi:DNA-binding NtrC family response regulator